MSVPAEIEEFLEILNDRSSYEFFLLSILAMGLVFTIALVVFFCYKRNVFYNRRELFFAKTGTKFKIDTFSRPWILDCFTWSSKQIYDHLGIDSLILLKTTRLFLILASGISIISLITVLPVHLTFAKANINIFVGSSAYSVKEGSNLLFVHLVLSYLITLMVCVILFYGWKDIVLFRQQLFKDQHVSTASLLFSDLLESHVLRDSFEEEISDKITKISGKKDHVTVHVLRNVHLIKGLLKKHNNLVLKRYEVQNPGDDSTGALAADGFRYTDTSATELDKMLQENYENLRKRAITSESYKLRAAAVILSNVGLAQAFRCTSLSLHENDVHVTALPERTAIIWRNLEVNPHIKKLNSGLIWILTAVFILFSSIPFAATASIRALILKEFSQYFKHDTSFGFMAIKFLIETVIPVFLIQLFLWIQHRIFHKLSTYENHVSYPKAEFSILKKMCIFNSVNTFFIYTLSSSFLGFLPELLNHPLHIAVNLVPSIPIQSNFYMVFLAFQALIVLPWILLKADDFLMEKFSWVCSKISSTPRSSSRDIHARFRPTNSFYIYKYSYLLLIFGVGLVFILITPLISVVWVPYFAIAYLVFTYDEERNNVNVYLYSGEFWPIVSDIVISYLVFMQFVMVGMFTIKKHLFLPLFLLPNVIFTIIYSQYLKKRFRRVFDFPTHDTMKEIEEINDVKIHNKLKQYYVDSFIPPINVTSSDHLWAYVLERELELRTHQ